MGSVFLVSFVTDEYADYKNVQQDLSVEASVEFDVDDLEWNEGDDVEDWHFVCNMSSKGIRYINNDEPAVTNDIHKSLEQWRGLVRKYSPRERINISC